MANCLRLNATKTQYMIFKRGRTPAPLLDIKVESVQIKQTTETKFLGCVLDDRLSAGAHVDKLCNKMSRSIFLLKNLCDIAGPRIGKITYDAYVNSHLTYCMGFWCNAPKSKLNKLYRLQRRAVRTIAPSVDVTESSKSLGILPLPKAITHQVCGFLHDQILGRGPSVLDVEFLGSNRNTRAQGNRIIKVNDENLELERTLCM